MQIRLEMNGERQKMKWMLIVSLQYKLNIYLFFSSLYFNKLKLTIIKYYKCISFFFCLLGRITFSTIRYIATVFKKSVDIWIHWVVHTAHVLIVSLKTPWDCKRHTFARWLWFVSFNDCMPVKLPEPAHVVTLQTNIHNIARWWKRNVILCSFRFRRSILTIRHQWEEKEKVKYFYVLLKINIYEPSNIDSNYVELSIFWFIKTNW